MDACYIARRNAITVPALQHFRSCVEKFHALRDMFIQAGVRTSISLPRQHALNLVLESPVQSGLLPIFGKTETKTGL